MKPTTNKLGELLRDSRRGLKLSQEDLGKSVGLNRLTISEYELGRVRYPRKETLQKFAEGLHLPLAELLKAAYLEENHD